MARGGDRHASSCEKREKRRQWTEERSHITYTLRTPHPALKLTYTCEYPTNNTMVYYSSQSSTSSSETDDGVTYLSDIQNKSTVRVGPFGIDPLNYFEFVVCCLGLWLVFLFIPRGIRFSYCGSYPKRYAWSARTKRRRQNGHLPRYNQNGNNSGGGSIVSMNTAESVSTMNTNHRELSAQGIGNGTDGNSVYSNMTGPGPRSQQPYRPQSLPEEEVVDFTSPQPNTSSIHRNNNNNNYNQWNNQSNSITPAAAAINQNTPFSSGAASTFNDEIAISTTMQQLRDTGVQIIAHGSKGKPKKVRLVLTENAIEWRTESKKKNKIGKMHQVPLTHIMYVDVGKATTALRRVENASIPESLCLSLLTKDGSLDLEASSGLERDALVNCFSLVLDEVHNQNWRDVYRAPSSEMRSSFDEYDYMNGAAGGRMEV